MGLDPEVLAILVSAVTSLVTVLVTLAAKGISESQAQEIQESEQYRLWAAKFEEMADRYREEIVTTHRLLLERESELAELREAIRCRDRKIAELEAHVDRLQAEVDRLRRSVNGGGVK